jgi:RNA polymerase sigma-70 factor (ECF subfamily)
MPGRRMSHPIISPNGQARILSFQKRLRALSHGWVARTTRLMMPTIPVAARSRGKREHRMNAVLSERISRDDEDTGADQASAASSLTLSAMVQDHLGDQLRALYTTFTQETLPPTLLELIDRLRASRPSQEDRTTDFRDGLLAALPALRGFALSLTTPSGADDLVQETLLKAWQYHHRFTPGTNLNAWLMTILRNQFYTAMRKNRREVEDVDGAAAAQLMVLPNQEHTATLEKVALQLRRLPAGQREALMLVGAQPGQPVPGGVGRSAGTREPCFIRRGLMRQAKSRFQNMIL